MKHILFRYYSVIKRIIIAYWMDMVDGGGWRGIIGFRF